MQRKVKFPNEFDALDIMTDELRKKMQPVSRKRIEIEKARDERQKVRKRTRAAVPATQAARPPGSNAGSGTEANAVAASSSDVEMSEPAVEQPAAGDELHQEEWYREHEKTELEALIDPSIKADIGASQTGLYDLVGEFILFACRYQYCVLTKYRYVAIVTHKGAAADSGHYIAFVARRALTGKEEDENWVKFDDDKVSVFPTEKLGTLDGGGEDSSAYVLLYKSKGL